MLQLIINPAHQACRTFYVVVAVVSDFIPKWKAGSSVTVSSRYASTKDLFGEKNTSGLRLLKKGQNYVISGENSWRETIQIAL